MSEAISSSTNFFQDPFAKPLNSKKLTNGLHQDQSPITDNLDSVAIKKKHTYSVNPLSAAKVDEFMGSNKLIKPGEFFKNKTKLFDSNQKSPIPANNKHIYLSSTTPQPESFEDYINRERIIRFIAQKGNSYIIKTLSAEDDAEIIIEAQERGEIGFIEEKDGKQVVKFSETLAKTFNFSTIKSLEIIGRTGITFHTNVTFEALSDKELELLRLAVKTYITFLHAYPPKKEEDTTYKKDPLKNLQQAYTSIDIESGRRNLSKKIDSLELLLQQPIFRISDRTDSNIKKHFEEQKKIEEDARACLLKDRIIKAEIQKSETLKELVKIENIKQTIEKQENQSDKLDGIKNKLWTNISYFTHLKTMLSN